MDLKPISYPPRRALGAQQLPVYIAGKPPLQQALHDLLTADGFKDVHAVAKEDFLRMGIAGALRIAR